FTAPDSDHLSASLARKLGAKLPLGARKRRALEKSQVNRGPRSLSHPVPTLGCMEKETVGRVIGTEDATPLEFWVGVSPHAFLQLDDVVALQRVLPDGEIVKVYGVVSQVRARHDGVRFDSDVFL